MGKRERQADAELNGTGIAIKEGIPRHVPAWKALAVKTF
jgi:hypothetical protein